MLWRPDRGGAEHLAACDQEDQDLLRVLLDLLDAQVFDQETFNVFFCLIVFLGGISHDGLGVRDFWGDRTG